MDTHQATTSSMNTASTPAEARKRQPGSLVVVLIEIDIGLHGGVAIPEGEELRRAIHVRQAR
jgi:hypothetical protein